MICLESFIYNDFEPKIKNETLSYFIFTQSHVDK